MERFEVWLELAKAPSAVTNAEHGRGGPREGDLRSAGLWEVTGPLLVVTLQCLGGFDLGRVGLRCSPDIFHKVAPPSPRR